MWGFGKSREVKCPDGSIKTVYKDVNDAFPLFIQGYDGNLAAKINTESIGGAHIDGSYSTRIDGLLYALD